MAKIKIKVPAAGESVTEATLSEWLKADGEYVEQNEDILVLETDKASLEVVAEQSGQLRAKVKEGETVQVGDVIAIIDTDATGATQSTSKTKAATSALGASASAASSASATTPLKKGLSLNKGAFDAIIIGSGPGGYVGAIRCAQLGLKTAVIEKDPTYGGTCLNVGCIPSKALLDSSEHFHTSQHELSEHGIKLKEVSLDLSTMIQRKNKIVSDLTDGVAYLFKKNKITTFKGKGQLIGLNQIEVTDDSGKAQTVEGHNIILATGSTPNTLPGLEYNGETIVSSTEALAFKKVPQRMVVVGGGAIGLEIGSIWSRLGTQVTVIEFAKKICGSMDTSLSKKLMQSLKKQSMDFILESKVTGVNKKGKTLKVTYENLKSGTKDQIDTDVVLVAVGRLPFSEGLGLENLGIEKDQHGFVKVDHHLRTKYKHIYAIGDLVPGPMLAHKAEEEGVAAAETIAGQSGHVNYDTVPSVIYTWPEFATVGKTEEELKAAGIAIKTGTFPFSANGRAKAMNMTEGQVKVIADKATDKVLGVHIVGPRASDMIAEAVVVMEFSGSAEDLARSFHAHPTLSEVMREAALNVDNAARQM